MIRRHAQTHPHGYPSNDAFEEQVSTCGGTPNNLLPNEIPDMTATFQEL